jgi:hypothetical protein
MDTLRAKENPAGMNLRGRNGDLLAYSNRFRRGLREGAGR